MGPGGVRVALLQPACTSLLFHPAGTRGLGSLHSVERGPGFCSLSTSHVILQGRAVPSRWSVSLYGTDFQVVLPIFHSVAVCSSLTAALNLKVLGALGYDALLNINLKELPV